MQSASAAEELKDTAVQIYGDERATELQSNLARLGAAIASVRAYPLASEIEPAVAVSLVPHELSERSADL